MRWKILSIGTTSARQSNPTDYIVDMCEFISDYWANHSGTWISNQYSFTLKMIECGLVTTEKTKKEDLEKIARQKTSSLQQIGLLDSERKLTSLGVSLAGDDKDSFLPFLNSKQAAFLIGALNFKYKDYFILRNILEFCVNKDINKISLKDFGYDFMKVDGISIEQLENTIRSQLPITDFNAFKEIVHHQKGDSFNIKYYDFFKWLLDNPTVSPKIAFKKLKSVATGKTNLCLLTHFFGTSKFKEVKDFIIDISDFQIIKSMLLAKLDALVQEYTDQNKRMLIATGVCSFDNEFMYISDAFLDCLKQLGINMLGNIVKTEDIFISTIDNFIFENKYTDVREAMLDKRSQEFEEYLDDYLTFDKVLEFLQDMSRSDYSTISAFFDDAGKDNATYAEFIISVAFHYLTNRTNNFIESWNGTLNNDNTPKRHAGGGKPDAQFSCGGEQIIVETTIQTGMQQVANEIGPISRHLHSHPGQNKYAVLFAQITNEEVKRQMELHRRADEEMHIMVFSEFINHLCVDGYYQFKDVINNV